MCYKRRRPSKAQHHPNEHFSNTFYLHQESKETNQAKSILMESFLDYVPITTNDELASWANQDMFHQISHTKTQKQTPPSPVFPPRNSSSTESNKIKSDYSKEKSYNRSAFPADIYYSQASSNHNLCGGNFVRQRNSYSSPKLRQKKQIKFLPSTPQAHTGRRDRSQPKSQSSFSNSKQKPMSHFLLNHLYRRQRKSKVEEMMRVEYRRRMWKKDGQSEEKRGSAGEKGKSKWNAMWMKQVELLG